jgi:hypothetical protein
MAKIISLDNLRDLMMGNEGAGVLICMEPEEVLSQKTADGKAQELWVFDPATCVIRRGDGKFFQVEYIDRGGWGQMAIHEEPNLPDGQLVGQVVVQMNAAGQVRVRRSKGLNGEILELSPSSQSKDEVLTDRGMLGGLLETNCQRIVGVVGAVLLSTEFPEEEAMWIDDFIIESKDSRSITALAKLGLLRSNAAERRTTTE